MTAFPADEDRSHGTIQGKKSDIDAAVIFQPRKVPKTPQVMQELIRIVPKLATIAHLDDREITTLVEAMQLREFPAGTVIYSAGELLDNPEVYFVLRGHVVIHQKTVSGQAERVIPQGSHFGEQEVTANSARIATARAAVTMTQPTTCYALDEEHLRNILTAGAHNKRERYVKWLEKIEWLKNLDRQKKIQLADALETKKYKKGEKLISYGLPGEWMYIIEEGRVDIWGFSDQHVPITENPVCSFGIGDCVGELEFIAEDPAFHITQADVVAGTDVRTVRLHQRHFELCLGPIKDVLKDQVANLEKFEYIRARMKRAKNLFRYK